MSGSITLHHFREINYEQEITRNKEHSGNTIITDCWTYILVINIIMNLNYTPMKIHSDRIPTMGIQLGSSFSSLAVKHCDELLVT